MDDAVAFGDCWLREVVVQELDGVGEEKRLGCAVDDAEAAVVVKRGADVEAAAAAEVPRLLDVRLFVDDNGAADGSKGCGVEVERAVEVLSGRHFWHQD